MAELLIMVLTNLISLFVSDFDLSLRWANMQSCRKCCVPAHTQKVGYHAKYE